jgi:hypothetical protein
LNVATNGVENLELGTTEVVFNDGGADVDFRVEGDTKANLFKVDAGLDTVIIDGLTHPSADGTADQSLVTNGSAVLSFASRSRLVSGTVVASTSGTSIDFTGIPSWVKKITVMFSGVSTNGISDILLQLGDSGGIETTGYLGASVSIADANVTTGENFTTGFGSITQLAAHVCHGFLSIVQLTGDTWICSGTVARSNVSNVISTAGSKTLSAALTQIRITTNGADTFDAGSINIIYEG